MRKYHRWLSVIFGVFLLWISVTGIASHVSELIANGGFKAEERGAKPATAPAMAVIPAAQAHEDEVAAIKPAPANAPFVCPAEMTCRPKAPPTGARAWTGYFHHLHSGEEFGPFGTIISLLSGIALLFFSFSGLWMYTRMWSHRRDKDHKPAWFWK
jgi:hypothetical protein